MLQEAMPQVTVDFDCLYARWRPSITFLAHQYGSTCVGGIDAPDYESAMTWALWRLSAERPSACQVRTYVRRMLLNTCRDVWRRAHAMMACDPARLYEPGPDPCADVLDQAVLAQAIAVIRDLPDATRAAMQLWAAGQRYEDIAARLQVPLNTVRTRVHYGRALLRRRLGLDEQGCP